MIDIDPALRSTLGFHIGYEKDSMHAKLAGTLRQIGNFGEGMVLEPRPKLANFTYSCQPSIEAKVSKCQNIDKEILFRNSIAVCLIKRHGLWAEGAQRLVQI